MVLSPKIQGFVVTFSIQIAMLMNFEVKFPGNSMWSIFIILIFDGYISILGW